MTSIGAGRHQGMGKPWVCLMYHDVAAAPIQAGDVPQRFAVGRAEFAQQLDYLRSRDFTGCALSAALSGTLARPIAISFDDGNAGQYERGFRDLVARGMTATFFVTTDWVGRPGFATWEQLKEMRAAGMDVQSHSRSHPFLSELDAGELEQELRGSRDTLDERLDQRTEMLALPGGDWPRRALRPMIADSGYRVVATSRWGINHAATPKDPVIVRRCTIAHGVEITTFGRVAAGDPALARRRGLREGFLGGLRSTLGATRYAALRRRFLDAIATGTG